MPHFVWILQRTTHISLNDLVQLKFTFNYLFLLKKLKVNCFFDDKHGQYTVVCHNLGIL